MNKDRRIVWLFAGIVAGIGLASIWPHEPLDAATADRNEKFAVITTPVGLQTEGVFVLDFLTGRLTGAVLSKTRGGGVGFTNFYYRNVAEDFQVAGNATPNYAVSSGFADIPAAGGVRWGQSALYVAEMNSGKVAAYGVPYKITQVAQPPSPLVPIGNFPFREATITE